MGENKIHEARFDDDMFNRLKRWTTTVNQDEPIIAGDDVTVRDVAALIGEIEWLKKRLDSERNRLGDECDRLVLEWYEKVKEVEDKLGCYEPSPRCDGCGEHLRINWVCDSGERPECSGGPQKQPPDQSGR